MRPSYVELLDKVKELETRISVNEASTGLGTFFSNNEAIMLIIDPQSLGILHANIAAEKFYGYDEAVLTSMKISDLNLLSEVEIKERILTAKQNQSNTFQFKHRTASGEIKDVQVYQNKIKYHDGRDVFSIVVLDISMISQAEEKMVLSNQQLSMMQKLAGVGTYTINLESSELKLSNSILELIGKGKSSNVYDLYDFVKSTFHPEDIQHVDKIIVDAIENKENIKYNNHFSFRFLHPTKGTIYVDSFIRILQEKVVTGIIIDVTDNKLSQLAIVESESRYRQYFEDDISGLYRSTPEGRLLDCNNAFAVMTGYTVDELMSLNTVSLYPDPKDRRTVINKIIKEKELKNYEVKLRTKSGDIIHCIQNVIGTFDEYGNLLVYQGYVFNITERESIRLQLEESEYRFRELFERSSDSILIIHNREFVDCNEATIKLLKYDNKQELINLHPSELSPKYQPDGRESLEKANEMMDICIAHGTHRFEWDHITKFGEVIPIEVVLTAIYNDADKEIIHTVWRDIRENKIARLKLEESERRFRELYEKSGDAILILEDSDITDCNEKLLSLFGYTNKEEIIGKAPWDISPEYQPDGKKSSEKAEEMLNNSLNLGTYRFEWIHKKKSGSEFPVEVLLTTINQDSGKTIVHAVCNDISQHKSNEAELISAKEKAEESDRLKSAFLANMSHEIRTPMNGILGFASLLKLPDLNREQLQKYVEIIEKSGVRMLNIINDLMDISKIESGQMEVVNNFCNVNEQIKYLHSLFYQEAKSQVLVLEYNCGLSDKESVTYTDGDKLYAIMANLIKNAIKYSDEGTIEFGYTHEDKSLVFFVKDKGIGIPKERQSAIFERFIQADIDDKKAKEGAGLGLAISKAYTEMLGGKIWVESDINKGARFFFNIPYLPNSPIKISENKVSIGSDVMKESRKIKILVVEDEEFAYSFLEICLKSIASEIIRAKDGKEAIVSCRDNPDIDLILMDIKMPKVNGYVATREIRKFNSKVIIIAQTAYALQGDMHKALKAGCNDYISKPIDRVTLIEKIATYLG